MSEVFCSKCKHFDPQYCIVGPDPGKCNASKNRRSITSHATWKDPEKSIVINDKHPREINSSNDCMWYEEGVRWPT